MLEFGVGRRVEEVTGVTPTAHRPSAKCSPYSLPQLVNTAAKIIDYGGLAPIW
jgi:hypothetical protein